MQIPSSIQTEPHEMEDIGLRCRECKHLGLSMHGIPYSKKWKSVPNCAKFHCYRIPEQNACASFELPDITK